MKTQLSNMRNVRNAAMFLLFLACSAIVSGQQTHHGNMPVQNLRAPHTAQLLGSAPHVHTPRANHPGQFAPTTVCDTDLFMDYAAYNEVYTELNGLNYNGSWYTGTNGLYLNGMTSYITKASGDSGYVSYVGIVFDTLLFSNPIDTASGYIPAASSTIYFDSLGMYEALSGDSTRMTNDSVIFKIYSLTNGTFSTNPVKTMVYKGWSQLKQFYAPAGYLNYVQLPVHYQFTQGQTFAVTVQYHNKRTGNILSLAYSYADSCGTVPYGGNTYSSPAYTPLLPGNEFFGSINADTANVVDDLDNTAGFFGLGFPLSCSFTYTQNWALFPVVTICSSVTPPAATVTSTNVNCHGQSTGSAAASATGGNGTFTYAWSNGATTSSISNVAAGTYTVTVTSNGLTATASTTITQPSTSLTTAPSSTQTGCTVNTGTAAANASGGTAGYTYVWSNSATAASLTGLAANTYNVTVTDSKGCTATGTTTVSIPPAFSVSVSVTNIVCFGQSTGSATATASGTTGTLTYGWNGGTTQTINNLPAGTYTVTVTETNGCSSTASGTVTQSGTAVTANASSTQTACGSNTGTATVVAGGGTAGYTYSWSNSGTTSTINNIGVGNYNVTVSDANHCTASSTTSVNTSATFVINVASTDVNCFGQSTGTATANVSGASGTVIYVWSNGATTQGITSVAAGTYNVTITDASQCPKTSSVTVAQPSAALAVSVSTTPSNCSTNTGTATATVSGGTTAYTYFWSNSSTASTVSGLGAGSVNLTVTDSKGCTVTGSGSITQPPAFTVSLTTGAVSCNGQTSGSVTAAVTGNGAFTYLWSNSETSSSIANVAAGNYLVTVTDAFGCTVTATSTVTQPTAVSVTVSTTDATNGNNGSATASVSGGTSPYQYNWPGAVTYATDSALAPGTYTVTVTDANNCSSSASGTIVATGINAVNGNITNISLIPNPANDMVKVIVSLGSAQNVEFRLVDIAGKYIYDAHESASQGNVIHQIKLSDYAAGIYLVEISVGNEIVRKKLVITR